MKTRSGWLRVAALAALAMASPTANAALLDHGPGDPTFVWPTWYRDLNGLPLQLCRSTTQSPNALAGLAPMCFPLATDPAGFPGNIGPEVFYNNINATLGAKQRPVGVQQFAMVYLAAIEAGYLAAPGTPIHGQEVTFARIRIVINALVAGTYKVTHPFGVEIFPDVPVGPRAVTFTNDMTPIPGNFDGALAGRVGPFITWDALLPGESLTVTNSAGQQEQFVGDPNYAHTFTGSPFNTNYIRVDGPPGSNLDGAGNDYIQTPLANVLGQKYLLPIPTPLTVTRATYSRDPVKNLNAVDVLARSAPTASLIVSGTDMPSLVMKTDGHGNFYAHLEYAATKPLPASVTVTNVADNPPTQATAALADLVNVTGATFDTLTGTLKVTATSSDLSVPPPTLAVSGPLGGPMSAAGEYSVVLPAGALPPPRVTVQSAAAGSDSDDVVFLPGLPMNLPTAPVAVPDTLTTSSNVAATVDLAANDAVLPPASVASIVFTQLPANGTVAPGPTLGTATYTPAANYAGADTFSYVLVDSTGAVSNVGTVAVTVTFAAAAPIANGDNWAQAKSTSRTVSVIANDTATTGTTIDPKTVAIVVRPLHGTATPNPDGSVTYTPLSGYTGSDTFNYTVSNNFGMASNAATVYVVVSGGPEVLSFSKVQYTVSKAKWVIVGSTNVFGPGLTPTATCYVGSGTSGPVIGSAPIDTTGKFQLQPLVAPPPDTTNKVTCASTNGGVATTGITFN